MLNSMGKGLPAVKRDHPTDKFTTPLELYEATIHITRCRVVRLVPILLYIAEMISECGCRFVKHRRT